MLLLGESTTGSSPKAEGRRGSTTFALQSPLICLVKPLLAESSKAQSPHHVRYLPICLLFQMLLICSHLLQQPGVLLPLPRLEAETAARARALYL